MLIMRGATWVEERFEIGEVFHGEQVLLVGGWWVRR